ncbi:MAG: murein L,D-transpeptidase catalytic domain family protein [Alistipes sp.]|nr:murein L,D-transpeptidase catalytic domain family protein [Alistipes sp.]MBR4045667.1 murein L,D-transpeptidase catalytic domain family protein [Alistipes sp.]
MSLRSRITKRANELLAFCKREGYNTSIALFVDLSLHSGRNRFVVWDFEAEKPLLICPVSHGSGSQKPHKRSAYAKLSNEDGSHLSSVGRAVVAERYEGRYGIAYRLDGLEDSNSNLRPRCVVLHGWEHTTSFPIFPFATVGSFGCPVLSRKMMAKVDSLIRDESKVILDIFV